VLVVGFVVSGDVFDESDVCVVFDGDLVVVVD